MEKHDFSNICIPVDATSRTVKVVGTGVPGTGYTAVFGMDEWIDFDTTMDGNSFEVNQSGQSSGGRLSYGKPGRADQHYRQQQFYLVAGRKWIGTGNFWGAELAHD